MVKYFLVCLALYLNEFFPYIQFKSKDLSIAVLPAMCLVLLILIWTNVHLYMYNSLLPHLIVNLEDFIINLPPSLLSGRGIVLQMKMQIWSKALPNKQQLSFQSQIQAAYVCRKISVNCALDREKHEKARFCLLVLLPHISEPYAPYQKLFFSPFLTVPPQAKQALPLCPDAPPQIYLVETLSQREYSN